MILSHLLAQPPSLVGLRIVIFLVKEFHIGEARLLPSMIRSEKTFKPKSNNCKVDQKAALSPGDDDRWWCQYMVGTAIGDASLLELSVE